MERITDSRRASCSSNSSSSNNGLLTSRSRRPRFQTNEDEDELYQVGMMSLEEEETVPELRDRRAWRKERERERLRKLLNTGKKKRRRLTTKPSKTFCSGGSSSVVTVEPYKKTEAVGGQEETGLFAQSHHGGTTLKLKRSFGSYTDQPLTNSSSVPRKLRSVGLRRKGQIWRSIEFRSKVDGPPPTQVLQHHTTSTLAQKDDIEAEIAEVLYGLKSQPCPSSEDVETESDADRPTTTSTKLGNKSTQISVALPRGEPSLSASRRKLKGEGAKIPLRIKRKQILSPLQAKAETVSDKGKEMVVESEDDLKLFAEFPGNQSDSVKKDSKTTNENPTSQTIKMEKPEKFMIDLMAPPPMESCTEDEGVATFGTEAKINNFLESKMGIVTRDLIEGTFNKDEVNRKKHKPEDVLVKCESTDSVLDRRYQQRDRNSNLVLAQSSSSSMPPWLTGGLSVQHQSIASPKLVDSTSQPKRCNTHHRIARSILIHQHAMRSKSFFPEMGVCRGTISSNSSYNLPKAEKAVFENLTQASSVVSVKEESRDSEMYPHKYHHASSYQFPQPVLPYCATGRSFISSQSQSQVRAMSTSQIEESIMPATASVMRLSYLSKPNSNEVSEAAAARGETSRRMAAFYRGQSQPPSQVFSPIHNIPPLSGAASYHHQSTTHGKKDSILTHQWHQQSETNLLGGGSENNQPMEQQLNFAPFQSDLRCLSFSANQNPRHHVSLSKPHAASTSPPASIGGGRGTLVVDCSSRNQYSLPSFATTQSRIGHPTMKTYQVPASVKNQPSSLTASANHCPRDFSVIPENLFEEKGPSFAPQARMNFPLKLSSDVFISQPHSIPTTDQLSKQNSTAHHNLLQMVSLGRNNPALQVAQSQHPHLQSLNSNSMQYINSFLASKSRRTTPISTLTNCSSDSSRSSSKGELLIPIGQTDSTFGGGFSQKSSLIVCGSKVPTIVGIHPNRPQELKY